MALTDRQLELPAGTFHALQGGDAEAPPLLYLHGFPDHPPTAAPFLERLCARGHHVLAPWLRGYSPSPLAGPFDLGTLAGDTIAIVDAWGQDRPVDVVGHDWGAAITYLACVRSPRRFASATTLAVPHPLTFLRQLRSPAQLRRSWYMALFQLPGAARVVGARDLALIRRLWNRWSPQLALDGRRRDDLLECLASSLPAPIRYYRAALSPRGAGRALRELQRPVPTPLLQLHGADDGCIAPPPADDGHRFAARRELEVVPSVGHFLQLEAPDEIATRVSAWTRRAAASASTVTGRESGLGS